MSDKSEKHNPTSVRNLRSRQIGILVDPQAQSTMAESGDPNPQPTEYQQPPPTPTHSNATDDESAGYEDEGAVGFPPIEEPVDQHPPLHDPPSHTHGQQNPELDLKTMMLLLSQQMTDMKQQLNTKIDTQTQQNNTNTQTLSQQLNTKIDTLTQQNVQLNEKIDTNTHTLTQTLNTKIDALDTKIDTNIHCLTQHVNQKLQELETDINHQVVGLNLRVDSTNKKIDDVANTFRDQLDKCNRDFDDRITTQEASLQRVSVEIGSHRNEIKHIRDNHSILSHTVNVNLEKNKARHSQLESIIDSKCDSLKETITAQMNKLKILEESTPETVLRNYLENSNLIQSRVQELVSNSHSGLANQSALNRTYCPPTEMSAAAETITKFTHELQLTGPHPLEFVQSFKDLLNSEQIPSSQAKTMLIFCLEGEAKRWAISRKNDFNDIDGFLEAFQQQFWGREVQDRFISNYLYKPIYSNRGTYSYLFQIRYKWAKYLSISVQENHLVELLISKLPVSHQQQLIGINYSFQQINDALERLDRMVPPSYGNPHTTTTPRNPSNVNFNKSPGTSINHNTTPYNRPTPSAPSAPKQNFIAPNPGVRRNPPRAAKQPPKHVQNRDVNCTLCISRPEMGHTHIPSPENSCLLTPNGLKAQEEL